MKSTKLFYSIDGLDYGEILAMHAVVKQKDDADRSKRGAKVGRIRKHQPISPQQAKELEEYRATLPPVDNGLPFDDDDFFEIPAEKPARIKPMPKDKTLIKKYEFFIHNLISRQLSSADNIAYLSSTVLQAVFDKDYKLIKRTLLALGIIQYDGFYDIGTKSYGYYLTHEYRSKIKVEHKSIYYPYKPYVDTLNEQLRKIEKRSETSAREILTNDFYNDYLSSLQLLSLSHPQEAYKFIDIHFNKSNYSKAYYLYTISQYTQHTQYPIQVPNTRDNRIYHILTSTPRNLKYFLNLQYSIDIHNSHPLLFTKYLLDSYVIPLSLRRDLTTYIKEIYLSNKLYNVRVKLYNKLKQKGIDYPKIKDIPLDVIKYIYLTSSGRFWDEIIPQLKSPEDGKYNIIRQDVKVIMFAQVFYGKSLSSRGQEYAKIFAKRFPNVYKIILLYKRGLEKEARTVLSHKLMALESKLFREALKRLFQLGYKVVSIHDAIVVLDVKENKACTPELVKGILTDVYAEEGLVPDCSVDYYGEKEMQSFLDKESFLRKRGDEYIAELRAMDDDEIRKMVNDYDDGKSEIVLTPDKKDVMLHLRDVRELLYG